MRVFGCCAWALNNIDCNEKCVFIGYPENTKAYRLWHIKEKKIVITRDVIFQEDYFPFKDDETKDKFENEVHIFVYNELRSDLSKRNLEVSIRSIKAYVT
ncbi:hypothetical protein QE152_g21962 [Popillia japonica]|uniref:Retroviral polymerase SH3-like domain-containing protein n=1 Tax=Popillia japonica TaxID=7064 RepID=A0AAW1KMR4_POPJA